MTADNTSPISLELRHIKKDYYVENAPFTAIKDLSVCFPRPVWYWAARWRFCLCCPGFCRESISAGSV